MIAAMSILMLLLGIPAFAGLGIYAIYLMLRNASHSRKAKRYLEWDRENPDKPFFQNPYYGFWDKH